MQRLSGLIFLLAIQPIHGGEPYSLKTIESNPIPRKEFFMLLQRKAPGLCKNHPVYSFDFANHSYKRFTKDECVELMKRRLTSCAKRFEPKVPAIVSKQETFRKMGRQYFDCVLPGVFCDGIEVKTEAQFKAHCSELERTPMG